MAQKRSRAAFESVNPPSHAPFAIYGTPLPAYDPDARDDGSYVPVWKQEVTDERGRKRLHGAFTGGFSAGYFNTVGSKEGWTPSTFVSSRSNRAKDGEKGKGREQKVEDFMDEEDRAEQAESQKLETQGAFAGLGSSSAGEGGKGMFADLFRATGDTMGVKLLQRMGWRQGQGIGPKVRRRVKGDKDGEVHLFAPEDTMMISFVRKTDRKGIGFAGEERLADPRQDAGGEEEDDADAGQDARILTTSRSVLLAKSKKLGFKKSGGFGTGVLNDTGSDDEDDEAIMGPRISYNRIIGGDKVKPKKKGGITASNATPKPLTFSSTKKLEQRSSTLSGFRKCHDGRLPLDGFILTSRPLLILVESKYPPPAVPEGWKPSHLSASNSARPGKEWQSTAEVAKASTLDPKSRAELLGEQQLPGKSVFDFISPAARNKLVAASGRSDLPQALGEKAPEDYQPNEAELRKSMWDLVPNLDKATADAALQRGRSGFMPYSEDEAKRNRYVAFLELKAGMTSTLPAKRMGMTTDEWRNELHEFAKAAEVFRPISSLMASRFTSSASSGPRVASDAPDRPAEKEDDPAEKAAKLDMFGLGLTRSRAQFFPTRLLCKRFNVKAPANVDPSNTDAGDGGASGSGTKDLVSQASLDRMAREANWGGLAGGKGFVSGGVEGGDNLLAKSMTQAPEQVDAEKNEAFEAEKPGEDIFKAIFGSDDEDE